MFIILNDLLPNFLVFLACDAMLARYMVWSCVGMYVCLSHGRSSTNMAKHKITQTVAYVQTSCYDDGSIRLHYRVIAVV